MTENKRFIRIVDHLEKEVRIYDTINEKKIFNIFFNELDSAICLNGALTDTVDLLNELHEENNALREIINDVLNSLLQTDFAKKEYCNALLRVIGEENDVEKTKQRIKEYIYD